MSSYKIYMDDGLSGSPFYLATLVDLTTLEYEATGLFNSRLYTFTVSAINVIGESDQSDTVEILAATVPEPPEEAITVS